MALGKVEICGVNTSKLPVLKNEEKQALFCQDRAGGFNGKGGIYQGELKAGTERDKKIFAVQ